jgi:hypothetical protein
MGRDNSIVARGPAFVHPRPAGVLMADKKRPSDAHGPESIGHSRKVQAQSAVWGKSLAEGWSPGLLEGRGDLLFHVWPWSIFHNRAKRAFAGDDKVLTKGQG